jgi:protein phosphatase
MVAASFAFSDTGAVRARNEDALLLDAERGWFAVADGLGGLPGGDQASHLLLQMLRRQLADGSINLAEAMAVTNRELRKIGLSRYPSGFGSTLTLARLIDDSTCTGIQVAHVGDSAAWLVSGGQARCLTTEHTVGRLMMDAPDGVDEDIPASAYHRLTQCMGQMASIEPQIIDLPLCSGDRCFLCSDGVSKALAAERLEQLLALPASLDVVCQQITFAVEAAGAPDNYTLVAFEVG